MRPLRRPLTRGAAVGSEGSHAGVDGAVDGLHDDGWAVDGLDLLGALTRDDQNLANLQAVRVGDAISPHELLDRAVVSFGDLAERVARLHGDRSRALLGQRVGPDLCQVDALVGSRHKVGKAGGRPAGNYDLSDGRRGGGVAEQVDHRGGGRFGDLVLAAARGDRQNE